MSYFGHQSVAERYARSRPYFHLLVIDKIAAFTGTDTPLSYALDVGCGTGQSTVALREIAAQVVGTDISIDMLAQAQAVIGTAYVQAIAEQLPFADAAFELMTVSMAFHWFDRARFLTEANRVLKPQGWLVIYDNNFMGRMRENPEPEYDEWVRNVYLQRYQTPARNSAPLTGEDAERFGFRFMGRETYSNDVAQTPEENAAYLMTQSNVIAAVEQGTERAEEVYNWLLASIEPMFRGASGTFVFGGSIWYLQKWYNNR